MAQHIPPFAALRAFEATARTGRVILAADELCVTHAAISHQIRKLEEWFGIELFSRHGDGMRPTDAGAEYARSVNHAFGLLSDATSRLWSHTKSESVGINSLSLFFEAWVLPNVRAFWREYPQIDINVICTNSLFDIHPSEPDFDLAIRVGNETTAYWPGYVSRPILPCSRVPLCSPSYLQSIGPIDTLDKLISCDLIDDTTDDWFDFLQFHKCPKDIALNRTIYSDLSQSLASAILGDGIVLASRALVKRYLRLGTLVALDEFEITSDSFYYHLCWNPQNERQDVEIVKDWLLSASSELTS